MQFRAASVAFICSELILEQFKQIYSRCFAAAESAGLRQQLGQCVLTQPLRCCRSPASPGARKSVATLLFKML